MDTTQTRKLYEISLTYFRTIYVDAESEEQAWSHPEVEDAINPFSPLEFDEGKCKQLTGTKEEIARSGRHGEVFTCKEEDGE